MTWAQCLSQYGYLALAVGCFLEGETLLLLAGVAAHAGLLSLPAVVAVAFVCGSLGDQFCFFLGRRHGEALLERWPRFDAPAARVRHLVERHAEWLIVGVRFMYGLRLVGPVVIGMSDVPAGRFVVFNMIGAAIWACAIAGAGFFFGHAIRWLLSDIEMFEKVALVCIVVLVVALLARQAIRSRRS